MGHSHTGRSAGACETDKVLRTDIGREDRRTYGDPSSVFTAEEVIGGIILLLTHYPYDNADQGYKEKPYDKPVKKLHGDWLLMVSYFSIPNLKIQRLEYFSPGSSTTEGHWGLLGLSG